MSGTNVSNDARNSEYQPDIIREDATWKRISCTCGGMLGMTNGRMIRIRHRDRRHGANKVAYVYIDLSGTYPRVVAEIPVESGDGGNQP